MYWKWKVVEAMWRVATANQGHEVAGKSNGNKSHSSHGESKGFCPTFLSRYGWASSSSIQKDGIQIIIFVLKISNFWFGYRVHAHCWLVWGMIPCMLHRFLRCPWFPQKSQALEVSEVNTGQSCRWEVRRGGGGFRWRTKL